METKAIQNIPINLWFFWKLTRMDFAAIKSG